MDAVPAPALGVGALHASGRAAPSEAVSSFHWTPAKIVLSLVLFVVAGLAEIGGGWLVWQVTQLRCKARSVSKAWQWDHH